MYYLKRYYKLFFSFALMICFFFTSSYVASAKYFEDITSLSLTRRDAVNYMTDNGYMAGVSTTKFLPNASVTRAMAVTVLYAMAGKPDYDDVANPFSDVSRSDWFYRSTLWALKNNITSGTSATTFSPNRVISREQWAIMLNKYAQLRNEQNRNGYITNSTTSIYKVKDASSISTYAKNAVGWAIERNIFNIENSRFRPQDDVIRADMAYTAHNYCVNVEGIVFGVDNFKFLNQPYYFTSTSNNNYYISPVDYKKLKTFINNIYTNESTEAIMTKIDYNLSKEWSGSCFGMSMCAILDKKGMIGFNENLSIPRNNINSVDKPKNNMEVLSRINFYHETQFIPAVVAPRITSANNQNTNQKVLQYLLKCLKKYNIVQFSYAYTENNVGKAHAVVAYGYEPIAYNIYNIFIYDPNCAFTKIYEYNANIGEIGIDEDLTHLAINNDFSIFRRFDYDGIYNELDLQEPLLQLNNPILDFDINQSDFTITNEVGQYLHYDSANMSFEGNMPYTDVQFTEDTMSITLKSKENFVIDTSGSENTFALLSEKIFASIQGKGISQINISSIGKVDVQGDDLEYTVAVDNFSDEEPLIEIEGKATSNLCLDTSDGKMQISGASGELKVVKYDSQRMYESKIDMEIIDLEKNEHIDMLPLYIDTKEIGYQ